MPSDLQVSNIKANDGTAGISIADSTGRVSFTETNPSITLGSNATFGSGVSLSNATFPSGHTLQIVSYTNAYNTDVTSTGYTVVDSASGVDWEPQIDMLKSTSKLLAIFSLSLTGVRNGGADGRGKFDLEQNINGGGWSTAVGGHEAWGTYDYGNNGIWSNSLTSIQHYSAPNTTGIVKYRLSIRVTDSGATVRHGGDPGTTNRQSQVTFIEIAG
jgi:hypothetical protein